MKKIQVTAKLFFLISFSLFYNSCRKENNNSANKIDSNAFYAQRSITIEEAKDYYYTYFKNNPERKKDVLEIRSDEDNTSLLPNWSIGLDLSFIDSPGNFISVPSSLVVSGKAGYRKIMFARVNSTIVGVVATVHIDPNYFANNNGKIDKANFTGKIYFQLLSKKILSCIEYKEGKIIKYLIPVQSTNLEEDDIVWSTVGQEFTVIGKSDGGFNYNAFEFFANTGLPCYGCSGGNNNNSVGSSGNQDSQDAILNESVYDINLIGDQLPVNCKSFNFQSGLSGQSSNWQEAVVTGVSITYNNPLNNETSTINLTFTIGTPTERGGTSISAGSAATASAIATESAFKTASQFAADGKGIKTSATIINKFISELGKNLSASLPGSTAQNGNKASGKVTPSKIVIYPSGDPRNNVPCR